MREGHNCPTERNQEKIMMTMMTTSSKEQAAAAGTGNEWRREKPILPVRRGSEISRMRMVMMMALSTLPRSCWPCHHR